MLAASIEGWSEKQLLVCVVSHQEKVMLCKFLRVFHLVHWFPAPVPLSRDIKENCVEGSDLFSVVEFN